MKNRILIIEDDWMVLQLMKQKLEKMGYVVATAKNESDVWGLINENRIELIILNICLRTKLGGKIYRSLVDARVGQKIPFIITTGITDKHQPLRSFHDEGYIFFPKPVDFETLHQEIEEVLSSGLNHHVA